MLNVAEQTKILTGYLPEGKAYLAKSIPDSNLYKFLRACAFSYLSLNGDIEAMFDELDPTTTEDLISEWEREFGIPDDCLDVAATLEERRNNIIAKIKMDGVTTVEDFEALADVFDIPVQVSPGYDFSALPFILGESVLGGSDIYFTMFVDFPESFDVNRLPFTLGVDKLGSFSSNIVQCLFDKLKPADVQAIYRFIL